MGRLQTSLCTLSLLPLVLAAGACGDPGEDGDRYTTTLTASASGTPTADDSGTESSTTGPKLDVSGDDSNGDNPCAEGGGGGGLEEIAFSNIWIANSPEGTVSRVDTVSGNHVGRYATGPSNASDPSRTTVNLEGDVAVLNRQGSVIKIASEEERCIDANNDGFIQTSTSDVALGWGAEECVLWETQLHAGARAAAWDSGNDPDAEDCVGTPSLWVSAMDGQNTIHVWRLSGDDGSEEGHATIPGWAGSAEWGGLYGGAVDRGRNFWAIGKDDPALFRTDFDTMDITRYDAPNDVGRLYGIAMDKAGNPYVTSEFNNRLLRFDAETETWEDLATIQGTLRGLAVDEDGDAWIATNGNCGLARYHHDNGAVDTINLPECNIPVGVSIDVDGFVWVVDQWAGNPPFGRAHKIDPQGYNIELTVMGFDTPYTYSDMTGAGLDLVSFPPEG